MRITYNGNSDTQNVITFSQIPNIVRVQDEDTGTKATLQITVNSSPVQVTDTDGQWYFSFYGDTVRNVQNYRNAVGKNFYLSESTQTIASSIARALRSCPVIAADFDVFTSNNTVTVQAKVIGEVTPEIATNMDDYITTAFTNGTASSSLHGAEVMLDVFTYDEETDVTDYITTLSKHFYNDSTDFNVTPVINTFSTYDNALPYSFKLWYYKDGVTYSLGEIGNNYVAVGYMCNQGEKFLDNSQFNLAANYTRGTNENADNNTKLYVFGDSLMFSFYNGNVGRMDIEIDYVDSKNEVMASSTTEWRNTQSSKKRWDYELGLSNQLKTISTYIDIKLGTQYKLRYNVIKPLKLSEGYTRLMWYNSYGGWSFFDFTGKKEETRTSTKKTYEKSIYDYYTDDMNSLEKVYDNDVEYTVTLNSHLFEKSGKYLFNDLIQSPKVWAVVNGQKYEVIIDSVSVAENQTQNEVYQATVKYRYSQKPSIF